MSGGHADTSVFGDLSDYLRLCRLPVLGLGADLSHVLRNAYAVINLAGRAHVMREIAHDSL